MIVTLYWVEVAVESRWGVCVSRHAEWSWSPSACSSSTTTDRLITTRTAGKPVRVKAPVGSRFDAATGRLHTHSAATGLDAASVAHCAHWGLDGFALAGDELPAIAAATLVPERWGIAFESRWLPGRRSWLCRYEANHVLESTNDVDSAMTWPRAHDALDWLKRVNLPLDKPVPIGVGYLFPRVVLLAVEHMPGVAFELPLRRPRTNWDPMPAKPAVTSRPAGALAGQLAFAFDPKPTPGDAS